MPVVPGLNDDDENLAAVASLAASLAPGIRRVNLLPYHATGVGKHEQLGRSAGEDARLRRPGNEWNSWPGASRPPVSKRRSRIEP